MFDLLVEHGRDITAEPLFERKARLDMLLGVPMRSVLFVSYFEEGGEQLFREAVPPAEAGGRDRQAREQPLSAGSA